MNNDSSGFEHVFVGEEKDGKITGLHNWVQYYLEEAKGNIDYLGWSGKRDSDYGARLAEIDWQELYSQREGYLLIEAV